MVNFTLPAAPEGERWSLLLDTNMPELPEGAPFDFGQAYEVTGRSALLFELI